jgi:hypothetical protein
MFDERAVMQLEDRVTALAGILNGTHGALVDLVAQALEDRAWEQWGIHSPEHWLSWKAGVDRSTAAKVVRIARRVAELPCTAAALREGRLSLDQAAVIARHVPAGYEQDACDFAQVATLRQLHSSLAAYAYDPTEPPPTPATGAAPVDDRRSLPVESNLVDPLDAGSTSAVGFVSSPEEGPDSEGDAAPSDAPAPRAPLPDPALRIEEVREVSRWHDDDGTWHLRASLPADQGAVVDQALSARKDDLYRAREDEGAQGSAERTDGGRPGEQIALPRVTLADALVSVALGSLAEGADAHPQADRYRIHLHLEARPAGDLTARFRGRPRLGGPRPVEDPELATPPGLAPAGPPPSEPSGSGEAIPSAPDAPSSELPMDGRPVDGGAAPAGDQADVADRSPAHPPDHLPLGPGVLRFHLGPVLPSHLERLILCDAELEPVWKSEGTPLAYGRTKRTVPGRLRRLIEHRDGGCVVPGCPITRLLHIHHVIHWEDGGLTDPDNLVALCIGHHRMHHLGQMAIHGTPSTGLTFTTRTGIRLHVAPRPAAPAPGRTPHELATDAGLPTDTYRHPLGERMRRDDFHLNDRSPPPPASRDGTEGSAAA